MCGVEPDPRGRQHEIHMPLVSPAPVLENLLQIELTYHVMCCKQCVHVSLEAKLSVDRALVELDLDEAVRVCTNDEVDFRPIDHDNFLDVVYNVRELLLGDALHGPVHLCRLKLSVEDFILLDPS